MMTRVCFLLLLGASLAAAGPLDDLAAVKPLRSFRASSFDPTGGNRDAVLELAPGASVQLLSTRGPGRINHMWFTSSGFNGHDTRLRDIVLRIWWEGAAVPSVEVPLGDFFALGHGRTYTLRSFPVAVGGSDLALNCYWPMPFYKRARVELFNNGTRTVRSIFYHIDYELGRIPPHQGLFHAQFRRVPDLRSQAAEGNLTGADNYVILDTRGEGQYVGCVLSVDAAPGGWWGEGDDMIFIDEAATPTIIGTGSEDYFCNAWGFAVPFSYPYYGAPLVEKLSDGHTLTSVYRWHIQDPIRFTRRIRVTLERTFPGNATNDFTSIAYWYQRKPIGSREPLPKGKSNHPRLHAGTGPTAPGTNASRIVISGPELEESLNACGLATKVRFATGGRFTGRGWLELMPNGPAEFTVPVPAEGRYHVELKLVGSATEGSPRLGFRGAAPVALNLDPNASRPIAFDLGAGSSENGRLSLVVADSRKVGIDAVILRRVE